MLDIITVLQRTQEYFSKQGIASPRLDAELILGHILQLSRVEIYLKFDQPLHEKELQDIRELVRRRGNREPMAYLLGTKGFYKQDFIVTPGVLCPRPDTETLLDVALDIIPKEEEWFIADIGCGSGCIGISLMLERPICKLYAVDISEKAIECTKKNVQLFSLEKRVAVLKGQLLNPIPNTRPIDLIVSNPPYIPTNDISKLQPEVGQFEPNLALDGGSDGLDIYKRLIPKAIERTRIGIILEVGIGQANEVATILKKTGCSKITTHQDLNGIERIVCGIK
jgi:release factor glutamine methyltransferase